MSDQGTGPPAVNEFAQRHIGASDEQASTMLAAIGCSSLDQLLEQAVPASIYESRAGFDVGPALTEHEMLSRLRSIADANKQIKPMIGQGYYGTVMPAPIQRRVLENPSWYTAYTPYQPEISQGRLEMLLNFQTLCAELTGLPHANASLLDEATACAEAMTILRRTHKDQAASKFLVDDDLFVQTHAVLQTRAEPLGIEIVRCPSDDSFDASGAFGALLSYPLASGGVHDRSALIAKLNAAGVQVAMCADILALCLLKPPGEMGAVIAVGSTQRLGLPMGCGGPHAAYMSFAQGLHSKVPGRIVGISRDKNGRRALRLALQTREQHIRRERATSNICTAQVLPAILAVSYALYHGRDGLRAIASRIHQQAGTLADAISAAGFELVADNFFDTITVKCANASELAQKAAIAGYELHVGQNDSISISCDETTTQDDIDALAGVFGARKGTDHAQNARMPDELVRKQGWLAQPIFGQLRSEHSLMRYLRRLSDRDISLDRSMIPLGSCTMKLNAASEMEALSWPSLSQVHPASSRQYQAGYTQLAEELGDMLIALTGMDCISLQPNAGSQGEYAGLLAIRGYHRSRGQPHRNVCLIPQSAHGTNAASAVMVGYRAVSVAIDKQGEVDLDDLVRLCEKHSDDLAALMITYPSTCGIYGQDIARICEQIHENGGQVYMDGANLNALVGVARPGKFGADVMHINLHKTFCIPHGGGGPGMGPIVAREHLNAHLPGNPLAGEAGAVSAAPLGSGLLLVISWAYIRMMGASGLRAATANAVIAANYMKQRMSKHWQIAYQGANGRVAHEFVIDARELKKSAGVSVEDIAKRLIDMGFHAPTVSFPLAGAVMIEPTESESLEEIDRFCEALERIREEIASIESGKFTRESNPLVNAPHPAEDLLAMQSDQQTYSAEQAAYPLEWVRSWKYFPPVSRVDQVYGDRNLVTVLRSDEIFDHSAAD